MSLGALLKNNGFTVITASSGAECIEQLSHEPDLVILDQFLPDIMGYELSEKVKKNNKNPHCQIIGVSSKKDRKLSSQFLKNFGNDFMYRPFDPEEFTNRVNQRAELIDHIRELERLSDEKNKFLAMVVHDLRNPLGAIQMAGNRIAKISSEPDKLEQPLSMISNSAQGMQGLISDLLDISAIESGTFELEKLALNMSEIIQESVANFSHKAELKNIIINASLPNSAMVEVDDKRIRQVVDNLLSNAIKYSPHETTVSVSLEKVGHKIVFSIEDQGPGIKKEHVSQLFLAFKRLGHATTGGESSHGLGLSICQKIVEAHHGRIKYKDSASGGSCFYVELPIE
jgi:signal transduction histidine kinase